MAIDRGRSAPAFVADGRQTLDVQWPALKGARDAFRGPDARPDLTDRRIAKRKVAAAAAASLRCVKPIHGEAKRSGLQRLITPHPLTPIEYNSIKRIPINEKILRYVAKQSLARRAYTIRMRKQ